MDEKKVTSAPEQSGDRDQALFASIRREKQRKKRRRIIVTVSIVVVLALAIFFGVRAAKKKVSEAVGSMNAPTVSEASALRRAAAFSNESPTKWVSFESLSKILF